MCWSASADSIRCLPLLSGRALKMQPGISKILRPSLAKRLLPSALSKPSLLSRGSARPKEGAKPYAEAQASFVRVSDLHDTNAAGGGLGGRFRGSLFVLQKEPTLTISKENLDRAHAQFRETVKSSGAGKSYTAQFELQADAVRAKSARLKALRLAKEATDAEAAIKKNATTKKRKLARVPGLRSRHDRELNWSRAD
jgi:hypothetical protein